MKLEDGTYVGVSRDVVVEVRTGKIRGTTGIHTYSLSESVHEEELLVSRMYGL